MKICVLICAYNEAEKISNVVTEVRGKGLDVIVVDDGSMDDTAKKATESGAVVIRHGKNLGKGAALKEGFRYVLNVPEYEAVITMDGDGQHHPGDIDSFIARYRESSPGIIVGTRMGQTRNMPLVRYLTNKFMSALLSMTAGQRIPDTQCGFRLISRKVLQGIRLTTSNYELESEILIKAARKGFNIDSVDVETIYTGEQSSIHPVKDGLRFIALMFRVYFKKNFTDEL